MTLESGDREAFLTRLRQRLAEPAEPPLRPIAPWSGSVGAVGYRADLSDRVAAFERALEAVAGQARRLAGRAERDALLAEICAAHTVRRAVVSRDPECDGVLDALRGLGVEAETLDSASQAAAADLGVTGAAFGVALTGSVLVDAERAGGRTASLLPPVHLALLRQDRIVDTPGAILRAMPKRPTALPSNLVLITGPSRSADIELQLTLGVHGPRYVWVGLVSE